MVHNGQSSNWSPILAGVPQGSILRPLLFLVYINDLPNNLESLAKLFADHTSLFSTVYNSLLSAEIMNKDLTKISKWANQWKMSFTHDINKQAQKVIFSQKSKKTDHPTVYFHDAPVAHLIAKIILEFILTKNSIFFNTSKKKHQKLIGVLE